MIGRHVVLLAAAVVALAYAPTASAQQQQKSGCTSNTVPQPGYLTSPEPGFDFFNSISPQVRFRAWWEVESINPSQDDFALEYSAAGGAWTPLSGTGFEPPSSPAGASPDLPLSNQGLRVRPNWQEYQVGLPEEAKVDDVRLRFRFEVRDNQYNGFRGLALDHVRITDGFATTTTYGFEDGLEGWSNTSFWRQQPNPQFVRVLSPHINPTLVTLAEGDDGSLPQTTFGNSVAWFGQPETGTFCGSDFSRYQSPLTLRLDPNQSQLETGKQATITATLNGDAGPIANQTIRYEISGPNATAAPQQLTTSDAGNAVISYTGQASGVDSITAYADTNGDGTLDADEPFAATTITWTGPPPPVPGRSVNVGVEEGIVLLKLPPGGEIVTRDGARIAGAKPRFVPITQSVQIPVKSILDTRRGRVGMTSASNLSGGTQKGSFTGGRFRITQKRTSRPVTQLRMTGGSFSSCRRSVNRSTARTAARRIRRLSGNARGRFRTRGRNSSATVRGTTWTMSDQCNGTLTRVRSGVVRVRDFGKQKTVTLRRGRSYLARPKRR